MNETFIELIHGECLEVMENVIPDKSVDLILCDLPYGTTACKWDSIIPLDKLWAHYKRISKGAVVLTASQPFTTRLIQSNIDDFKYELIWDKGRGFEPQLANIRPQKCHENIVVFCEGKTVYNPQMVPLEIADSRKGSGRKNNRKDGSGQNILASIGVDKVYTARFPLSICKFSNANQREKQHPTQKPVALMEYLIKTYTNPGDVVMDNCMGSGTTGVACKNLGRSFIGIEKDETYFKIAQQRINGASNGQMAT